MNSSNPGAPHYQCAIPQGITMKYFAQAAAANPYQTARVPCQVTQPGFMTPQQQIQFQQQQQQMQLQQQHMQQQVQLQQQQQQQQHQAAQQQQQQQQPARGRVMVEGSYGLLVLPNLIQQPANAEKSDNASFLYLTRGFDLQSLGINVAQQRPLHPTLASVALERPEVHVIPEYRIPECYRQARPKQPTLRMLQKYKNETLFYIFYSMPRDLLQTVAAKVLVTRGWLFHKVRQQWMRSVAQGGYEVFNQNTWKLEHEDLRQLNANDVMREVPDSFFPPPAASATAASSASAASPPPASADNNNNSATSGG